MKKLLKAYGFESKADYYCRVSMLYRNGDRKASRLMFIDMPKANRIEMSRETLFDWHTIEKHEQMFYFNLLTGLSK